MAGRSARASRRPSIFVFRFAARTYFRLLSRAAHAWGTPESAALLPGIVAQPPFSTYAACCHESVFFSSVRLLVASALRWNWSTQIGAMAATTALLAVLSANVFAELPSIHPPQPKPMTRVAIAPAATPCSSRVRDSPRYHTEFCMTFPPNLGRKDSSPPSGRATDRKGGALPPLRALSSDQ